MTESPITTGEQLYQGILDGKVPRQVRLFAAQGLLPVSRDHLYRLQVLLSADPDQELAAAAAASIKGEQEQGIIAWVNDHELPSLVLDLLTRLRDEERIWATVATCPQVSDETLRVMSRYGPPLIQDIIITNQVRLLGCLEILEDLKLNPKISPVVMRRVREFEAEFVDKAHSLEAEKTLEQVEDGPSIDEAIAALRAIGAHIPLEEQMPYAEYDDLVLDEEAEQLGLSAFGRLTRMNVKQKILCALKGTREERAILINSRNRLVVTAVLASPKLSDTEVERFAQLRSVSEDVIRLISSNRRWLRLYGVVVALVQNPKTPLQTSLNLLPHLNHRDMGKVARNRNAHPVVRRRAATLQAHRR